MRFSIPHWMFLGRKAVGANWPPPLYVYSTSGLRCLDVVEKLSSVPDGALVWTYRAEGGVQRLRVDRTLEVEGRRTNEVYVEVVKEEK